MTRSEHIAWCKKRALEELERGSLAAAWSSMVGDLGIHPETKSHPDLMLGVQLLVAGHLSTKEKMRKFIEDFS